MKKFLIVLAVMIAIITAVGCKDETKKTATPALASAPIATVGAYEIADNFVIGSLPENVATGFAAATDKLIGVGYSPVVYLGKQIVNGTNYAVLAETTVVGADKKNPVIVVINQKPGTIGSSADDFSLVSVDNLVDNFGLGGYEIDGLLAGMPQPVATGFDKVTQSLLGCEYTPIVYIGKQIVNGTNYMVLAKSKVVGIEGTDKIVKVVINQKPGTEDFSLVEITDVKL